MVADQRVLPMIQRRRYHFLNPNPPSRRLCQATSQREFPLKTWRVLRAASFYPLRRRQTEREREQRPNERKIPVEMRRNQLPSARPRRKLPPSNFPPEEEEEEDEEGESPGRERMEEERRADRLSEKEAVGFGRRMNRVWEAREDFQSLD